MNGISAQNAFTVYSWKLYSRFEPQLDTDYPQSLLENARIVP
jgi:hypothetical protein